MQALRKNLKEGNIFGRVGRDEFALFLTGLYSEEAFSLADRIRESIAAKALMLGNGRSSVTISVGMAETGLKIPDDAVWASFKALFEKADAAVYAAKAAGRNCVSVS